MSCPSCGFDNPAENKFCAECGSELAAVCSACGASNPPSGKFCGECGTALGATATQTAPDRAEQRLVSVLFADIVGFTPFSESRDSEEVRAMLTEYFDRSRAIVERFGGSVDKFIGDAVMAVWGAVEAQEDDAERGVRAALELVDMVAALGEEIGVPDLSLRAGVMTGETSVGPGGNEKGLVVGDLVNTASRLQSIAEPRTVLVGEPTRNLTAASIRYEALGEQTVKGKDQPVAAFRAVRVTGEIGGGRQGEDLEAPFTGRDVELRLLKDQLHACASDQSARLVAVFGEAGIGKTRLAWELEKYIDGLAHDVYWHRGRSPSYGDGLAMWALGEMVRRRAGITETEEPAKARLKLRTAVAEYVGSEEDRRWLEPRLAALIGLEDAPAGDREELYAAIRTFFHHIADRGVTALVFEDMHWADPGLLDFIEELVERSPRHPILVVALSRPELLDSHPGWGSGRSSFLSVRLGPLSDDAMRTLVSGMVPGIPDEVAQAIVARAGGIPLYAVEFVRMLVGTGDLVLDEGVYRMTSEVADLALPDSLQAVIGARIDRMAPEDRELVQDAAVLGQSFTAEGLAMVRDTEIDSVVSDLDRLVRQHVLEIDEDPRSPERGSYVFVQSAIREVAYGRLSKSDRYGRHLKVAEYFESLTDGAELIGAVASHYLAAAEAAPEGEAGALLERGRSALSEAAARAAALQSNAAALSLYEQALELDPSQGDRAAMLESATRVAMWSGQVDRSLGLAQEATAAFEELGDEAGRLRSITLHGFILDSVFRTDEGVALLRDVFDAIDDPSTAEEVALGLETARAHMLDQDFEPAVEIVERVLGRAEAVLPPADVIDGLITKATALVALRRPMESAAILTGAISLADEHGLQAQAIRALNNLTFIQTFDSPRLASVGATELLSRARRLGAEVWIGRALLDAATVALFDGRLTDAADLLAEAADFSLPEADAATHVFMRAWYRVLVGEQGAVEEARAALAGFDESTDSQLVQLAAGLRGQVSFVSGDYEEAFDHALLDKTSVGQVLLIQTAVALVDPARLRQAADFVGEMVVEGRLTRASRALVEAALMAIDGVPGSGAAATEAVEAWARVVDPTSEAILRCLFCRLLPDDSGVRASGAQGLKWLRDHGLVGLEERLVEFVPNLDTVAETA